MHCRRQAFVVKSVTPTIIYQHLFSLRAHPSYKTGTFELTRMYFLLSSWVLLHWSLFITAVYHFQETLNGSEDIEKTLHLCISNHKSKSNTVFVWWVCCMSSPIKAMYSHPHPRLIFLRYDNFGVTVSSALPVWYQVNEKCGYFVLNVWNSFNGWKI